MALTHVILSVLIEKPSSGYDLVKKFDGSSAFLWKATHQQIYRELTKLESKGLLNGEKVRQENRPNKKVYYITEKGRKFLTDWIVQPTKISVMKDELLVKLLVGHLVSKQTILRELQRHRLEHLERLSKSQEIQQKYFPDPEALNIDDQFRYLILRRGIRYETEWLTWCDEAIMFLLEEDTNGRQ